MTTDDEVLDGIDGRVVGRSVLDRALQLHRNLSTGPSGQAWEEMTALVKTIAALHPQFAEDARTAACRCDRCCCSAVKLIDHG